MKNNLKVFVLLQQLNKISYFIIKGRKHSYNKCHQNNTCYANFVFHSDVTHQFWIIILFNCMVSNKPTNIACAVTEQHFLQIETY